MDGNGRWARNRQLPRSKGHEAGTRAAKATVTACRQRGIKHLTLYTFSKENWARPKEEVSFLFELLATFLTRETDTLLQQSVRLSILGELDDLPFIARQAVKHTCAKTAHCEAMILNLALNYSGRAEILRACKALLKQGVDPAAIDEERFKDFLYTAHQPDPDLIIRTSGELRLSNYLLYQSAYSELYFTDTLWPDFDEVELDKALESYAKRKRRFGMTNEQPKNRGPA
jgi:undecaprenyl diphosphate synthase